MGQKNITSLHILNFKINGGNGGDGGAGVEGVSSIQLGEGEG